MAIIVCPNTGPIYLKDGDEVIPLPPLASPHDAAQLLKAYLKLKRNGVEDFDKLLCE